jgi:hypothetical protein
MRQKVILSFDPGETTGYCAMTLKGTVRGFGEFSLSSRVVWLLRHYHPSVVVVESFALYPHKATSQIGSSFRTVEVIGVIRHECAQHHLVLVEQPANQRAFFSYRGRVRRYAPSVRGKHALDATRHLLYYLCFKTKTVPFQKETPS